MYDNQHIDISGAGHDGLVVALRIFLGSKGMVMGFALDKDFGMILFWTKPTNLPEFLPLPAPVNADALAPLIMSWLETTDYGRPPDHDGDNDKGWRVYNDNWARVAQRWEAKFAVQPKWMMAGK